MSISSFPLRAVSGGSSLIGTIYAGYMFNKKIQKDYPPIEIKDYSHQRFYYDNGQKYFIIGYFGATEDTIKNKLDLKNRELYTTPKLAIAQKYAMSATRDKAATALIVSPVRSVEAKDHGPQRFEGPHVPIRADALRELQAKVIRIDPVNPQTRVGFFGSVKRAYNAWKSGNNS